MNTGTDGWKDGYDGAGTQTAISSALRAAWPLPNDTFITEGLPELMTRLSLMPYSIASAEDAEAPSAGSPV